MSASISGLPTGGPFYSPNNKEDGPPPKPTVTQQLDTLASTGNAPQQIADDLGMTLAQVDSALGIQTTTDSSTTSATAALASRLSVHA